MANYTNPDGRQFTIPNYSDFSDGPQNFKDFASSMPSYGSDVKAVSGNVTMSMHDLSRVLMWSQGGEYTVTDELPTGAQVCIATRNAFVSVMTDTGVEAQPATERLIQPYSLVVLTKVAANFWMVAKGAGGVGNYFNSATGGTVTEVADYNGTGETWRVHTFTSAGSLEVIDSIQPFRVLVNGGGGGAPGSPGPAPNYNMAHGGNGTEYAAAALPVGSYPATIGNGGGGGPKDSGCGGTGGTTTFHTWTETGGAGACISSGGASGPSGPLSDITGTSIQYGDTGTAEAPNPNPGQGGRSQRSSGGGAGQPGVVIVAYQIG